ncbi:hypothetical protein [Nostoc sp. C057]|uniref:hypothetical protein n=1 Tax=Nostoc sp. C057 TaxID=2576903 RepID=UPI00277B5C20|nr:hypothetical protein [Nostoc sp. C057]
MRLTDDTWKALDIASECLGLTRADYLEHIVRHNTSPCITRERDLHQTSDSANVKDSVGLLTVRELEILRDHVLFELKLGKQATGYKTAQKVLNRFIAELIGSV